LTGVLALSPPVMETAAALAIWRWAALSLPTLTLSTCRWRAVRAAAAGELTVMAMTAEAAAARAAGRRVAAGVGQVAGLL